MTVLQASLWTTDDRFYTALMFLSWAFVAYKLQGKKWWLQASRLTVPPIAFFVFMFIAGLFFFAFTNYPYFLWFKRK
jgi:hypothetical protein